MTAAHSAPLNIRAEIEEWPMREPFQITGYVFEAVPVVVVTIEQGGVTGRGEAAGVYYRGDTPALILEQIEHARPRLGREITPAALQSLLPPGGARNALDCALWELRARQAGKPVWELAGLDAPRPLVTSFTCGAASAESMAANAAAFGDARVLKLKLTGEAEDADRVVAVRRARPDARIVVDANQGFTRASLATLMPVLVEQGVEMIEQPFPVGKEMWLDGLDTPIPIAADESVQSLADIAGLAQRVQMINIKLDKCGGFTEGLAMARAARGIGLGVMVGNMLGTSLAMAPAFLVGQLGSLVDLDGPVLLRRDRTPGALYADGAVRFPGSVWGAPD